MTVIFIDTRQQVGKHETKHQWFTEHGITTERRKLDFGDYATDASNIVVDTKRSVAEIAQNIGGKEHARFRRECERARDAGYRLVILIENNEGVLNLDTLQSWTNQHCRHCRHYFKRECDPHEAGKCKQHNTNKPIQGERLARAMATMSSKYGVRFNFCKPKDAAFYICSLLGVQWLALCKDCYMHHDGVCTYGNDERDVDGLAEICERGCPF